MKFRLKTNSDADLDLPEATKREVDRWGIQWWTIEINTPEELLALSKRVDCALEVSDGGDEPQIVIMDTPYR